MLLTAICLVFSLAITNSTFGQDLNESPKKIEIGENAQETVNNLFEMSKSNIDTNSYGKTQAIQIDPWESIETNEVDQDKIITNIIFIFGFVAVIGFIVYRVSIRKS